MLTDDEIFALFPEEEDDLALARAVEQAAYAAAIKACEAIETERWKQFKGRDENDADQSLRGNQHTEGCSDGASECADAIRALMTTQEQPK